MIELEKERNAGTDCFRPLPEVQGPAPSQFTQPFSYEAHPWVVAAARDLQSKLADEVGHDFGFRQDGKGLGKMMGVLVVRDREGRLGYLAAYSGRLDDGNHHPGFVPPVFDLLDENGFYRKEEDQITAINHEVIRLENEKEYLDLCLQLKNTEEAAATALQALKEKHRLAKEQRKIERQKPPLPDEQEQQTRLEQLDHESARHHYEWKDANRYWK